MTKGQIESGTFRFAQELSSRSLRKSASLLAEKYTFTVIASVLSLIAVTSIVLGDPEARILNRPYLSIYPS